MKTKRHAVTFLTGLTLAVAVSLAPTATLWADLPKAAVPPPTTSQRVTATMMGMPLQFEANHGQVDAHVTFLARGTGYTLFLTPTESVMVLQQRDTTTENDGRTVTDPTALPKQAPMKQAVVRMKLEGANPSPTIDGMEQLPGIVNYFIGNDPGKWRTNIPTYAKVQYQDAYPGIALAYYGNQGRLEYDFLVAPGADPNQIKLAFEGASDITVADSGDLVLVTAMGEVRMQKPIVYQVERTGQKTLVAGQYVVQDKSAARHSSRTVTYSVGFQLASYDHAKPVVIDPVLSWATYLGGSGDESFQGIAVDQAGNAYVIGYTTSSGFPGTTGSSIVSTNGALQGAHGGGWDTFVTKLNAAGTGLVYSTYLGGSGNDIGLGIAVDSAGQAYVTGYTYATSDFPGITASSIQSTHGGGDEDAFVTKLNAAGTALLYSTYLGGSGSDQSFAIAVDAGGSAYVTGFSNASGFPGTSGSSIVSTNGAIQSAFRGSGGSGGNYGDAFVTKLNAAGTGLVYSTYLGGSNDDAGYRNGIAVDQFGSAYVTGFSYASDFPGTAVSSIQSTNGAIQAAFGGGQDAFVTKLNPSGTALVYSTYLGGSGNDGGTGGIAVDQAGNAYVMGGTNSSDFPGTAGSSIVSTNGAFQPTHGGGGWDTFVTKLNMAGTALVYSTYLGGSGHDDPGGIAVDQAGQAYVTGNTSSGFPGITASSIQSTHAGIADAFVTKLNAAGTALVYSTYLGGSGNDWASGIALDWAGQAYVGGGTSTGSGFPGTAASSIQSTHGGSTWDGFVAKITTNVSFDAFAPKVTITLSPLANDDEFTIKATLTLGSSSDGIIPLSEVVLKVGSFGATIPVGSFTFQPAKKKQPAQYTFAGIIDGVTLNAKITPLGGNLFEFKAAGIGVNLTGTVNPVTVGLLLGDDQGNAEVTAAIIIQ